MPKGRAIGILTALVILYPISYLVASRDGAYEIHVVPLPPLEPEGIHYGIELEEVWEPFPSSKTSPGDFQSVVSKLYLPAALLDRKLWHRSRTLESR